MQRDNLVGRTVDITPDPRILRMLGEIAFEPHKCIGELIDNSIDAFLNGPSFESESPEINISVPHRNVVEAGSGQVVVEDNGRGMTLQQLVDAARAGYSSNSPVENLGLFGMGFNIATARLGRITQLRSGVVGENRWSVIEINLDALQRQGGFRITPRFESKRVGEHGTRVVIMDLRREQASQIASGISGGTLRSAAGLRNWLGRTYSKYLREPIPGQGDKSLKINLAGRTVEPYRWCIWGEERYVELGSSTRSGEMEKIYALQRFDHNLGEGEFCINCLAWMPPDLFEPEVCMFCRQESLVHRERRMKGWVGIQRHLDDEEFGFDFLRNGRAILQWDKRPFLWTDTDTGIPVPEYPIDEQRARHGRIVGEVEIDHVPVHYQKDSFEEDHPLWQEVVDNLRGRFPLRPNVARRNQMPVNDSLLANIYRGYNRTRTEEGGRTSNNQRTRRHPWKRDLIINQTIAKQYHERFLACDPDYQSDEKWFEWMQAADRQRVQDQDPGPHDPTDPDILRGNSGNGDREPTEQELLVQASERDDELSGPYGFQSAREIEVDVYRSKEKLWIEVTNQRVGVPIKVFRSPDGTMDCFYDADHPRFEGDDGTELADLVSSEVSWFLQQRHYERFPYSYVYGPVRASRLQGARGPISQIAGHLLDDLIPKMIRAYCNEEDNTVNQLKEFLSEDELIQLRGNVAESGGSQSDLDAVLDTGQFLNFMPHVLARMVRTYPHLFLDELIFTLPYSNVPTGIA